MAVDTDNTHAELPEHWQQGRHSLGWRLVVVTLGFCFFFHADHRWGSYLGGVARECPSNGH
ncbi:hypothetical protein MHL40_12105 [Pseudomonas luteola]|uniref:hypothetical protein n=1 Tax=Pseudomonas luteola TaxID=47886 RepID=UPI001EF4872E|nr:hypothetical protein [Pseudomonas luteola]MCG7373415.1 hypothetical protein [Pseudomonas luteola]